MTVRYCALTAANWPSASEIGRSSAVGPAFQGRCIFRHLDIWASGRFPGAAAVTRRAGPALLPIRQQIRTAGIHGEPAP